MFVLGLDPGLARTGYAVLEWRAGARRAVTAGVVRTAAHRPMAERLAEIHADLGALLTEYHIDEAAIEQVFTSNNRRTAIAVGRAAGVAMMTAAEAGVPIAEYTPTEVKAGVCGFGGADKDQMRRAVMQRLRLPSLDGPADIADAIAVALCHAQGAGRRRAVEQAG